MHTTHTKLALLALALLPALGCQPDVDLTQENWGCVTTGFGHKADLGGCEIEKNCGWNQGIDFDPVYDYAIGSVICLGEEGEVQQCDCIQDMPSPTVVHSFEYVAACEPDAVSELAEQCEWAASEDEAFSQGPPQSANVATSSDGDF
tara:strand:- start:18727 stop:19167 length:441 start_codon:yes stop_codon:yes gene_type:complete